MPQNVQATVMFVQDQQQLATIVQLTPHYAPVIAMSVPVQEHRLIAQEIILYVAIPLPPVSVPVLGPRLTANPVLLVIIAVIIPVCLRLLPPIPLLFPNRVLVQEQLLALELIAVQIVQKHIILVLQ
jgi:hypothetical protein